MDFKKNTFLHDEKNEGFLSQLKSERELAFKTLDLKMGDIVMHPTFGKGEVKQINISKNVNKINIIIDFELHSTKKMLFIFAELKKVQ